jgi:hypothetical protein
MADYEEALQQLHQAPLATFTAERKRLAAELRAQGDEAGAAQIAKRPKPLTSVWAVNQLYWQARDGFDALLAAAARVRAGDRDAAKPYHDAIATLRGRAESLMTEAGYAVSDATLRRVAITLAAIAVAGGFAPDPPGALSADRDPPGFETVSLAAQPLGDAPRAGDSDAASKQAARDRERQKREQAAEERERRKRETAERARRTAERSRVHSELRAASTEVRRRERAHALLEQQLRDAEKALNAARERMNDLETQLANLDAAD